MPRQLLGPTTLFCCTQQRFLMNRPYVIKVAMWVIERGQFQEGIKTCSVCWMPELNLAKVVHGDQVNTISMRWTILLRTKYHAPW